MKSYSQENKNMLSLDDLIPGGASYSRFQAQMPKELQWWGDKLLYFKNDSVILAPLVDGGKEDVLITRKTINEGLEGCGKKKLSALRDISFPYADLPVILIKHADEMFLYDFSGKKVLVSLKILKGSENIDFCKENKNFTFTSGNNLYIMSGHGKQQVTNETNTEIISGQAVHRNEFGIEKGTFWSPGGNYLAFYRMDETMVTDYPLVDVSARIAKLKNIKYPMAGMKSHQVTIGVYNLATHETVYLDTGTPKDKYLTNIAWSPDEKNIYVAELNRDQDTCKLKRYDTITGKLEAQLFGEVNSKYVEPEYPVLFVKNNPDHFVWLSKRDGHNHLYLYDINGKMIRQLTSGDWDIISVLGYDESGKNIYYVSTQESPIERNIYRLNLQNGKQIKLSGEPGIHEPVLSNTGKYMFDSYSSQFNPGKVSVINTESAESFVFYEAKNPVEHKIVPEILIGSLKADDGTTDLYYRMVKPVGFDESKKYPVIVYVYGGPHSQLVTNSWMGEVRGWDIHMANKGYIVFTLDNRGTNNRGSDFENIIHRQLGIVETEDQMTGLEFLKSLPYVDTGRIGVHGWSYGGFMTLNLMLRHPDTFRVGVAGGPVTDWKYYEIMYGERYMDSPAQNPDGYGESSMLNKAGNLKGRLLLIHGDEDPTVVMQHSLQFLKSSIKSGVHPDFFIYPGHGHNMRGKDRIHLHEHITRYFEDFLK